MARTNRAERATAGELAPKPAVSQQAAATADIARRAYELYLARGCEHGHDVDDWVRAERELGTSR
jgi:hypothetical protein